MKPWIITLAIAMAALVGLAVGRFTTPRWDTVNAGNGAIYVVNVRSGQTFLVMPEGKFEIAQR